MNRPDDRYRRLAAARHVASLAGDYLVQALWNTHVVSPKGPYDLSLDADTEASRLISSHLTDLFPQDFILEEDGPPDPETSPWVWIVDPLDGTVNYHHRLPWFCVSVACYHREESSDHPLWRHGRPVASVVLAPMLGQEFRALDGEGAWCGQRRLGVSTEPLDRGILSHSRGSAPGDQEWIRQFLGQTGAEARKTRSHGAAALDLAYVAQGSLAVHVQRSLRPWDTAAGAHLVLEAGGCFTAEPGPSGAQHVIAGGPEAHRRIEEVLSCASWS